MNLDLIIPAYNAKRTINTTLYSIALQENIEGLKVYIVNDGSKYDYSEEIEFFSKYLNISEIKLDKNSGPGVARNKGIENSNSKYIMFVDSDDYLYDPYAITSLYTSITDTTTKNLDVVSSKLLVGYHRDKCMSGDEFVWLHGKVYKRSFLKKNNIYFSDIIPDEDNFFNRLVVLSSPNIGYLDKITYVYCYNKFSISRRNNNAIRFSGIEGYTSNLYMSMKRFFDKKENLLGVAKTSAIVLISVYYYYLDLYEDYEEEIDKILIWSKGIKKIYDELKEKYLKEYMINNMLIARENYYKNSDYEVKKIISLEEFLQKVDEA